MHFCSVTTVLDLNSLVFKPLTPSPTKVCKPSRPQPGDLPSRLGGRQGSVCVPLQAFRGADVRLRRGRQQFERTGEFPGAEAQPFKAWTALQSRCGNVSRSSRESFVVQIFVHCDVVICDLKKREAGACNRRCPRPENRLKGMEHVQTLPADGNVGFPRG